MATRQRRDRGDGALYQRSSDGLFVAYARLESGKRKYVYSKTRGEAVKKLKLLQKEIDARTVVTARPETVEAFLLYWLSIRKGRKDIKASTVNTQSYHLKAMYPHVGHIKLAKLTGDHLQRMCNALLESHKVSTVHTMMLILSAAFHDAIKWKRLSYNPCKDVALPTAEKHDGPVLTGEQALVLLNVVKGHQLACWLSLALATGMRKGELIGLKWSDIDLETRVLKVARTATYLPGDDGHYQFHESTPKTQAGKRVITLPQFAITALKEQKIRQLEQRLLSGPAWNESGLVFCNAKGGYYALAPLERHFKKVLKDAGLPELRIHDLRHSSATLLLKMGVPLKVVQEILGHSNYSVTANTYGHVLSEQRDDAANRLDALFLSAK